MAELVREIMDADPVRVSATDDEVSHVVELLHSREIPGVPVVDERGMCVGIISEADLAIPDEEGDLHLPHYVSIFGGPVFLESLRGFERRLRKTFAATAADMMTPGPVTIGPDESVSQAARLDRLGRSQPVTCHCTRRPAARSRHAGGRA